jgi:hypothetical protein
MAEYFEGKTVFPILCDTCAAADLPEVNPGKGFAVADDSVFCLDILLLLSKV